MQQRRTESGSRVSVSFAYFHLSRLYQCHISAVLDSFPYPKKNPVRCVFRRTYASWVVSGMVLDVVVIVLRTRHSGKIVNMYTVDDEAAAEIDRLLDMAEAVLLKE
ncbi:hypothetical protein TNCV_2665101 [Trichonephila clavipes]|nr:hypothetical protein TNCV_2665101 [Trichonephila clavipes]